jgi:glucokinase
VVGSAPRFRTWFLAQVRDQTVLRTEQAAAAAFALVPDLDMAGARGSVLAAVQAPARPVAATRHPPPAKESSACR